MSEMSKREMIAAMCLQGILANSFFGQETNLVSENTLKLIGENALKYADALIAELNKTPAEA